MNSQSSFIDFFTSVIIACFTFVPIFAKGSHDTIASTDCESTKLRILSALSFTIVHCSFDKCLILLKKAGCNSKDIILLCSSSFFNSACVIHPFPAPSSTIRLLWQKGIGTIIFLTRYLELSVTDHTVFISCKACFKNNKLSLISKDYREMKQYLFHLKWMTWL